MKGRSQIILSTNLAIFSICCLPIFAQPAQTLQNLPDGQYFYGEIPEANRIATQYMIFQKTGETFTAFEYRSNTSDNSCLKGTISQNTFNIKTVAYPPDPGYDRPKWEFSSGKPFDFSKWYQLNISQLPDFGEKKLAECVRAFSTIPDNNK
ncbi:hypothetical protein QUB63_06320 [Microcoleus sp. ARI1-B5]|uniref:hypothetical protein n=1 Tax=unclassified Microcoleus TaxID=2642155 RepID=UPI002FD70220